LLSIPVWNGVASDMTSRIKTRHLHTLIAFMKTGSVTEAADMLATTQPNASKSLKQLENLVGLSLFQRIGGRLRPTPEAELLAGHAARLMEELDRFETLSSDLVSLKSGFVQIAILATFSTAVIPIAIERFNSRYPDIQVQVDILDSDKIHSYVSRGSYDFGLVHHPELEPDLMAQTLCTRAMVCLMPPGHHLSRNPVIMSADLADVPFISYPRTLPFGAAIHKALADEGVRSAMSVVSNQSQLVRRLVERGRGVALIDEFAVWDVAGDQALTLRRFEPRIPVSIGLIVSKRRPLSLAAQMFVASLREILAERPEPMLSRRRQSGSRERRSASNPG
jgi:DNA-binding transcriptional LysR family regulator